jgi:hypothetical protein
MSVLSFFKVRGSYCWKLIIIPVHPVHHTPTGRTSE